MKYEELFETTLITGLYTTETGGDDKTLFGKRFKGDDIPIMIGSEDDIKQRVYRIERNRDTEFRLIPSSLPSA